jgi:hypothetical protein
MDGHRRNCRRLLGSRKGRKRTLAGTPANTPIPPNGKSVRCQICRHPDRMRIEIAKLSGAGSDNIAMRFGVHRDAVYNHMKKHLDEADRVAMTPLSIKISIARPMSLGPHRPIDIGRPLSAVFPMFTARWRPSSLIP